MAAIEHRPERVDPPPAPPGGLPAPEPPVGPEVIVDEDDAEVLLDGYLPL